MSCIIPAGTFVSKQVRCVIHGDMFNQSGSDETVTFRIKLTDSGGTNTMTVVYDIPNISGRHNFIATLTLTPPATNQQTAFFAIESGLGNRYEVGGFTKAQEQQITLDVTVQLSAAHNDLEIRRFSTVVTVL